MEGKDERSEEAKELQKLLNNCLDRCKQLGANIFLIGAMPNGIIGEDGRAGNTVVAGMLGKKQELFNCVCSTLAKNLDMELFIADAAMAVLEHRVDKDKSNQKNI